MPPFCHTEHRPATPTVPLSLRGAIATWQSSPSFVIALSLRFAMNECHCEGMQYPRQSLIPARDSRATLRFAQNDSGRKLSYRAEAIAEVERISPFFLAIFRLTTNRPVAIATRRLSLSFKKILNNSPPNGICNPFQDFSRPQAALP